MKSILQDEKECYVCAHELVYAPYSHGKDYHTLECHHVLYGTSKRAQSEKYGLKLWLCHEHHTGDSGVHFNKPLDGLLKEMAQRKFEEVHKGRYNRTDFIRIFGKSYL